MFINLDAIALIEETNWSRHRRFNTWRFFYIKRDSNFLYKVSILLWIFLSWLLNFSEPHDSEEWLNGCRMFDRSLETHTTQLLGSPLYSGRFIIATSMVNTSSHTEEISQSTEKTYWHPTWITLVKVVLFVLFLRLWCLQWARDLCGAIGKTSWIWRLKDEGKEAPFIPSLHGLWWAWCHLARPRVDALPILNCGYCQCTSVTWCL